MYDGMCVVLNLGGSEASAIARRVRGTQVYCEVLPYDVPVSRIVSRNVRGVIIAGGEGNPFAEGAPEIAEEIYQLGLPMLGFGYGAGVMLRHASARALRSMPGRQTVQIHFEDSPLFEGLTDSERMVERLDDVEMPEGFRAIAFMDGDWTVAFEDVGNKRWGVQFYPEQNDPDGLTILHNFAVDICGCPTTWTLDHFVEDEIDFLREKIGSRQVVMCISGGVGSAVCAKLLHRAIGEQLHCVYVDTGLMRKGDSDSVRYAFEKIPDIRLTRIDAADRFLKRLDETTDGIKKRRLVASEMVGVFQDYAKEKGNIECIARGAIYEKVINRCKKPVEHMTGFEMLIEPVSRLFKEEIWRLGEAMDMPEEIMRQQEFPDVGLALRCQGTVTEEKLEVLRLADQIFRAEIEEAGLDRRIRQYFAILTDAKAGDNVGRMGYVVALRAVSWSGSTASASAYRLPYDLLERVVERITQEIPSVHRVVYDITGKPPAGIEWN